MEYKVIGASTWEMLLEAVNVHISHGYEPLGGICVDRGTFYQAMIRKPKASK